MKKIFISLFFAFAALTVNAQTVNVSTYSGTDMAQYAGQVKDVRAIRTIFKGWNTVSLPFAMTEQQVNETFGTDCRLEKLAAVSQDGNNIYLNFVDAKAQGIQANTPYILYFTGKTGGVTIYVKSVVLDDMPSEVSFTTEQGVAVSLNGAQQAKDGEGLYGILAADNQDAKFVRVTNASKFYTTRCYIEVSGATGDVNLVSLHNASDPNAAKTSAKQLGTYNVYGCPVNKNANGIKIINGKKVY